MRLLFLAFVLSACASDAPANQASVAAATPTSTVTVDYRGTLADGIVFDEGRGVTFSLTQVVPGFQRGVAGMRVGETKTLVIAPEDGYGAAGVPGTIPPNATLTFQVTLREVR